MDAVKVSSYALSAIFYEVKSQVTGSAVICPEMRKERSDRNRRTAILGFIGTVLCVL